MRTIVFPLLSLLLLVVSSPAAVIHSYTNRPSLSPTDLFLYESADHTSYYTITAEQLNDYFGAEEVPQWSENSTNSLEAVHATNADNAAVATFANSAALAGIANMAYALNTTNSALANAVMVTDTETNKVWVLVLPSSMIPTVLGDGSYGGIGATGGVLTAGTAGRTNILTGTQTSVNGARFGTTAFGANTIDFNNMQVRRANRLTIGAADIPVIDASQNFSGANATFSGSLTVSNGATIGTNCTIDASGTISITNAAGANRLLTLSVGSVAAIASIGQLNIGPTGGKWDINGSMWPDSDASQDIGLSSKRVRDGHFSRNVNIGNTLTASNGITLPPVSTYNGPICTNGVSHYWNHGGTNYLRWSNAGETTWTDKQLAP